MGAFIQSLLCATCFHSHGKKSQAGVIILNFQVKIQSHWDKEFTPNYAAREWGTGARAFSPPCCLLELPKKNFEKSWEFTNLPKISFYPILNQKITYSQDPKLLILLKKSQDNQNIWIVTSRALITGKDTWSWYSNFPVSPTVRCWKLTYHNIHRPPKYKWVKLIELKSRHYHPWINPVRETSKTKGRGKAESKRWGKDTKKN